MNWFAEVDAVKTSFVTGRLRRKSQAVTDAIPAIELWIDGVFESAHCLAPDEPEPFQFRIPLPSVCFDAQEHEVQIRTADRTYLQTFLSTYQGFIDPFSDNLITGWALDDSRPDTPVEIEFDVNGLPVARTFAGLYRDDLGAHRGFRHRLTRTADMQRSFVLRARIAGTDVDLQHSPVLSLALPRLVKAAQQINTAFHYLEERLLWQRGGRGPELHLTAEERRTFTDLILNGSSVADLIELKHRFLNQMQPQLSRIEARRDYSSLAADYPYSVPRRSRSAHMDRAIDVIVPIYAGLDDTERCLTSVLESAAGCRYELICILDNPAAKELAELVHRLAGVHPHIMVLEHETNLGFAESVNRAMLLHRDRDVVILQSDCEVHGDWLLRLQRAAYQGVGAGLVNPLTNHAEYSSYPGRDLELPEDAPFQRLDAIAKRVNAGCTVTLPAAMGFCLYARRGCLDDVGFFHNHKPSAGYFAEKYFSLNAAAVGWRTVLATDVFVKHRGFVSFAEQDGKALDDARHALDLWCPFYRDSVTDFIVDDPSLPARRELDLARIESLGLEHFCFVTHGEGGGTERHLQDLTEALALDGVGALTLFCFPDRRVSLATAALESVESLHYRLDDEFDRLVQDLIRLRVRHLHIHTNIAVPHEFFELPGRLKVPFDVTVHDYAWFCPRINLVNHSGAYCGEPPVAVCETCAGDGVAELRERSYSDLARARHVYCPSQDVLTRMQQQFGLTNLVLRPHPEWIGRPEWTIDNLAPGERVRVATIGRLSGHKGLRVLRECAAHALECSLPIDFLVVGATSDDAQFRELTNVEITGPYEEQDADRLIERLGIRVALLPSVWPETYSYTLSIALRCGLIPVAFDIGAIAERVRRANTGILLPLGAAPAEINEALLRAAQQPAVLPRSQSTGYLNMLRDYYGLT